MSYKLLIYKGFLFFVIFTINFLKRSYLENKLYKVQICGIISHKNKMLNKVKKYMKTDFENRFKFIEASVKEAIQNMPPSTINYVKKSIREYDDRYQSALDFYNKAVQVAKQMAAQYQVKKSAFERRNESFKSTGQINLSRIANYKTSDEIFHNKANVRQASNHGLVVMLDISHSMQKKIDYLAKQFLITALYGRFANINMEIYTFTNFNRIDSDFTIQQLVNSSSSVNHIRDLYFGLMLGAYATSYDFLNCVDMLNILSKDYISNLQKDLPISKTKMGGTPLIQASIFAYHRAMELKATGIENVSITFLTDGVATDDENVNITLTCPYSNRSFNIDYKKNSLQSVNKIIRLQNIKIFNIFICDNGYGAAKIRSTLLNYVKYKNVNPKLMASLELIDKSNKDNSIVIDELLDYNTFYAISPKSRFTSSSKGVKGTLLQNLEEMKAYSTLGEHLNSTVCQDFSLI